MTLSDIITYPMVVGNIHESVYRRYHILEKVLQMIDRGDSKETIFEVVGFLEDAPDPSMKNKKNIVADHPDDL